MWPRGQRQIPKLDRVLFLNLFNPVSVTLVHRSTAATRERTPARSRVLPVRCRSPHSQRGTGRVPVRGESPHSPQFCRQGRVYLFYLFSHHELADSHHYERIQSINGRNTPYGGIYPLIQGNGPQEGKGYIPGRNTPYGGIYPLIQERSTGRQGIPGRNPPDGGI